MNKLFLSFLLPILFSVSITIKSQPRVIDKVIAVVGNKIVLKSEIEEQYLQMQVQGLVTNKKQKCEIFEQVLFQKLLVVQAKIDSVEVSAKRIDAEIDGRIKSFIDRIGSKEKLEEYFGKSVLEMKEDFKPIIKEQIIAQKMQAEITKDVKVTPSDVRQFFNKIPIDSLPMIDAQFEIAQIVKKSRISKNEKTKVKAKLNKIRERIVSGESFKTLAVLYSEDESTSKNGGELGFVNKADLVTEFATAAFELEKNEISEIVESEFGFHIIKLIERKGNRINVRHILMIPKTSTDNKYKAKQELDSIAQIIRTDTLTFEQAAMKFSDDKDTKNNGGLMVNPYTGTSKFKIKQIEPSINFVLRKLKVGQISEPFQGSNKNSNDFKIIYLKSKIEAHKVNMKEDYQMIQEMAESAKKQKIINEWIKEIQSKTFIKIEDDYKHCKFNFPGWLK